MTKKDAALKQAQDFSEAVFSSMQQSSEPSAHGATAASEQGATKDTLKSAQQLPIDDFVSTDQADELEIASKPATLSWGWVLSFATLIIFALGQWGLWLVTSWQASWLQGSLVTLLTGLVSVLSIRFGYTEWRHWQVMKQRRKWREQAQKLTNTLQFGEAQWLCQQICQQLPAKELQAVIAQFQQSIQPEHSDAEQLKLFETIVLSQADELVNQRISQASIQTGVAVALSPFALADLILVLWRASRMVREIAQVYGDKPGLWRRLGLLKKFVETLFWTGASEVAIDVSSDFMGAELSSKISARAGQGLLAGLMVARLGRFVQQQLRPLPLALPPVNSVKGLLAAILKKLQGSAN